MFTGIIEETGTIKSISQGRDSAFITIGARKVLEGTVKGDSIAVNGVCLTVTSFTADSFTADAMPETLRRSSLGRLVPGSKVNLERAMQAGGRFGGHIVSGHVDACCRVLSITAAGIAKIVRIAVPEDLSALIAVKGSVAVDGASLTVTESGADYFAVSLIPHTASASTLGNLGAGDMVNVEADVFARYISHMLARAGATGYAQKQNGLSIEFLKENGF